MAHSIAGDGAAEGRESSAIRPRGERSAAQFAIGELLRVHAGEQTASFWGRLFGASPLGVESQPWFEAVVGELLVGDLLSGLGDEWVVFHSVPVGAFPGVSAGVHGGDLDHLVIGPAGCFTITVRNHPGLDVVVSGRTVMVAGAKVSYIRDAEHDLGRAERLLAGELGGGLVVTGILVFVEPKTLTSVEVPRDLEVLSSGALLPWLAAQPEVFDAAEVKRVAEGAGRSEVWGDAALASGDGASARRRFDALRRAVDRSRMLRQLWFSVVTIAAIVTATAIATLAIVNLVPGAH